MSPLHGAHADLGDDPFDRPDSRFNTLQGWSWIGCYGGYYLQANHLQEAGFEHGFFTRRWHGRGPDELAGYLSAGVSVHRPQQVHGAVVIEASSATGSPWPNGDGVVSDRGGQSLWVCGADCTPVLLADPVSGHAAACHAGWRGVARRILDEAILRLEQRGACRESLLVALGPAISGEHYQVNNSVALEVGASLDGTSHTIADLENLKVVTPDSKDGHCRLDIRAAARLQLQHAGLEASKIAMCPLCTLSEPSLFHSWRRDQVKAVQWSGIVGQAAESTFC